MNLRSIVSALRARRSGAGFMALCPAHQDRNPSLAIREVQGKVLLHCHAGCAQEDVLNALNERGLLQSGRYDKPPKRRIVETYLYTDEDGKGLYEVVRYDPKDFRQRRPDGHGGWIWKKAPRQVLYHLPEILEAPIVFVVEGERDCETLREFGFCATTNAGGALAPWLPEFTEFLRGREVVLIPDNDPPGRARVLTIARALLGNAAKLLIIELEDGKDITEWFALGHSEVELIAQVQGQETPK